MIISGIKDKNNNNNNNKSQDSGTMVLYSVMDTREFLKGFKTLECKIVGCNAGDNCQFYHSMDDRRRNPYNQYTMAYLQFLCAEYDCDYQTCKNCHNMTEIQYHPLSYLTSKCIKFYGGCDRKYCPNYHYNTQQQSLQNPFFRFDLNTFKTKNCMLPMIPGHNLKTCPFFHNKMDRRRPHFSHYQHVSCEFRDNCPFGDQCKYSHNKIQQLYHPSRYKSKFCEKYPDKISQCEYLQFCSFAHHDRQIVITLIHQKPKDADFFINEYKTIWCPYTNKHDRNKCVYAHNFQDFRRSPKMYHYEPQECEKWRMFQNLTSLEMGGCNKGMNCNKCHGWKEFEFHPLKFKGKTMKKYNAIVSTGIVATNVFEKEEILKKLEKNNNNATKFQKDMPGKKIEAVQHGQTLTHMIGAPFFIQENYSLQGKGFQPKLSGKNRGTASQKARENNFINSTRKDSDDLYGTSYPFFNHNNNNNNNNLFPSKLYNNCYYDDQLFNHKNIIEKDITYQNFTLKERTKSCSNNKDESFQSYYSKELKEEVNSNSILKSLHENKVNQVKLLNLSETQLLDLSFLTKEEKEWLLTKVKAFNQNQKKFVGEYYSAQLHKTFLMQNKHSILEKLRIKRIRETKLLNLAEKEIMEFSFLEAEQQKMLPLIIKEFNDNKEFSQINSMISQQTTNSNSTKERSSDAPNE